MSLFLKIRWWTLRLLLWILATYIDTFFANFEREILFSQHVGFDENGKPQAMREFYKNIENN